MTDLLAARRQDRRLFYESDVGGAVTLPFVGVSTTPKVTFERSVRIARVLEGEPGKSGTETSVAVSRYTP
jgi:hypothetical protein